MSSQNLQLFDFTQPSGIRSESADELSVWMDGVCSLMKEMWSEMSPSKREFSSRFAEVTSFQRFREKIDPQSLVFQAFVGKGELLTMLALDRPVALAYATEMIGESCTDLPEDRKLSPIEASLVDLLFESIADKFGTAWPQKQPIASRLGPQVLSPHRSRDFDPDQVLLVHKIRGEAEFGEHEFTWIAPQHELEEMVAGPDLKPVAENIEAQENIKEIARAIPVRISIELGNASVPVADLPKLSVGDLILLDQRIEDPIAVKVENELKFSAWPGKKGNRHAVQIETIH